MRAGVLVTWRDQSGPHGEVGLNRLGIGEEVAQRAAEEGLFLG